MRSDIELNCYQKWPLCDHLGGKKWKNQKYGNIMIKYGILVERKRE